MEYNLSSPKRIIQVLPAYFPREVYDLDSVARSGGGGRYVVELSKAVADIADTTLLTFGQKDSEFSVGRLRVIVYGYHSRLGTNNGKAGFNYRRVFNLFKGYEAIHAHQYHADTTLIAAIAAHIYAKKLYITDHGWRGATLSRYFPAKYFSTKLLGQTDYDLHRFHVPRKKFQAIYGGVDLEKYSFNPKKTKHVMFLGRLMPHKGVDYLIKAVDRSTECVVAGHQSDKRYFTLLKKLAEGKNVRFLISASDDEIRRNLRTASALVLPSVDRDVFGKRHNTTELFGLVVAEAFACGTPAIVSDSSALPYVVSEGIDGFVVPQNDPGAIKAKIAFLLNNPDDALAMGVNGRKKAESRYNWRSVAETCVKNYFEEENE
jgi:glycosyltransferase involved in cell wall biosynthesis